MMSIVRLHPRVRWGNYFPETVQCLEFFSLCNRAPKIKVERKRGPAGRLVTVIEDQKMNLRDESGSEKSAPSEPNTGKYLPHQNVEHAQQA